MLREIIFSGPPHETRSGFLQNGFKLVLDGRRGRGVIPHTLREIIESRLMNNSVFLDRVVVISPPPQVYANKI